MFSDASLGSHRVFAHEEVVQNRIIVHPDKCALFGGSHLLVSYLQCDLCKACLCMKLLSRVSGAQVGVACI